MYHCRQSCSDSCPDYLENKHREKQKDPINPEYPEGQDQAYQAAWYQWLEQYRQWYQEASHQPCPCPIKQHHVHEVLGSVKIAEPLCDPHNHRFATVSGEAIEAGQCDHVHLVWFRTDFYEDHFHEFCGYTCGAIPVGDRHVHFLHSVTTEVDGHQHAFRVGTLIDDPIGD